MKLRAPSRKPILLRAVHPNAGVTSWYAHTLSEALHVATLDAVRMLTEVFAEAPPTVGLAADALGAPQSEGVLDYLTGLTAHYKPVGNTIVFDGYHLAMDAPSSTKKIDDVLKKWGTKWGKRFDKLSRDVSKSFAKRSATATDAGMKAALKEAGFTVSFRPTKGVLESYKLVVADNVGLIRNLQADLYNKIQQDTWASVRAGGDMAKLSAKLVKSYGIEASRAQLIAVDQNNKAKAVLEATRRKELGLRQAIWQHSAGGKEPRPVHVAWGAERKVFDLDKGLFDPDEGEWVFPGQLIKCRCTSRAVIPGVEDDD